MGWFRRVITNRYVMNSSRSCAPAATRELGNRWAWMGVERCGGSNPLEIGPSECDLVFVWRSAALGLDHAPATPGASDPFRMRRTGGHTGPYGMACICGSGMADGEYGVRSSYDVVPTIVELLGEPLPPQLSGRSLLTLTKDHSSVSVPPLRQK